MNSTEKGALGPKESFEEMGARWERLNEVFDNRVRELIKYPDIQLTEADKEKIREQQRAVYELEAEILKIRGI